MKIAVCAKQIPDPATPYELDPATHFVVRPEDQVLDDLEDLMADEDAEVVAVDEALKSLAAVDEEMARIVELRFFGGLKNDEIAAVLGVSNVTVRRRFRVAKAWLYRHLTGGEDGEAAGDGDGG